MLYQNQKENEITNKENPNNTNKAQHKEFTIKTESNSREIKEAEINQEDKNRGNKKHTNKKNRSDINGFEELMKYIPAYKYDINPSERKTTKSIKRKQTIDIFPLDQIETNNNRFYDYLEAFLYIGKHCKKYHGKFTTQICKEYLKEYYIIDFIQDNFVPITSKLDKKLFNKYFYYTQRELTLKKYFSYLMLIINLFT